MMNDLNDLRSQFTKMFDTFNNMLNNESNPFVKIHLKELLSAFAEEKFDLPEDIPITKGLKEEMKSLAENIKMQKNLFPNEFKTELQQLKTLLSNLNFNEADFWKPADIFLKLPSILRLSRNDSKKIVNIIKNIKSSKEIEDFIKEKVESEELKEAHLEKEVKQYYRKDLNLKTLVSQIYLKKPKDLPVFEKIKLNLNNQNFFNNKTIYLSNLDSSMHFHGTIKATKLNNNGKITFDTQSVGGEDAEITVTFDQQKVIKANIINKVFKSLKDSIYSFYKYSKENDAILQAAYIKKNENFLFKKASVLSDGWYHLIVGRRFRMGTGHYLNFQNSQTGKKTEFEVYDKGIKNECVDMKDALIKHGNWDSHCDFDEFLRYFKILSEENFEISFNSEEEVNRHFQIKDNKIDESESFQIVKKTEEIYAKQSNIIAVLTESRPNGCLFDELIELLLTSPNYLFKDKNIFKKIEKHYRGESVIHGIDEILGIKKSLGQETDELKILTEIVKESNYSRLINKEQGIKTERLMELLTQGKQITDQMKGKTIIPFFGNTGSGKSTTVNYFAGIPLIKTVNNFGDEIIKIEEEEYIGSSAKIGHSLGTSETLYAQAYKLNEEAYQELIPVEKLKDLFLCDNPGFRDTRGTDFEICTNLSIDQSILNCGKIQAVVLVLPFSVFSLDRGNHLIEAILNLEERFPDLFDKKSQTHNSIFIAITKCNLDQQIEKFEQRLNTHIAEESRNIVEFSKNKEDQCKVYFLRKRIEIFNLLLSMFNSKQLFFVKIDDRIEREEIFHEIYKRKGIQKSKYNRSLEGSEMLRKFSQEISKTCHTWTKLILERYLIEIPNDLHKLRDLIKNLKDSITRKKKEIEELNESIEKCEKEISDLKIKLDKLNSSFEGIDNNLIAGDQEVEVKNTELVHLNEKLQSLKIRLKQKENDLKKTLKEMAELEEILIKLRMQKEEYSKGETEDVLVKDSFEWGEYYYYYPYKEGRMEKALKDVEPLKYDDDDENTKIKFRAGFEKLRFYTSEYIKKKYCLVPENTKFDEDGMLQRYQESGIGNYKAIIQSNLCKLTGINSSLDGKSLVIQYKKTLKIGIDMPSIKIIHFIPNEKVYADILIDINSEIDLSQSKFSTLQKYKNELETEIKSLSQDIKSLEKQVKEVQEIIKKILNAKSKELQIKQIKEQILILEGRITDSREEIKRKEQETVEEEARLDKAKTNLTMKEKEHQKLALVIWDQLEKKIPQSLYDYIEIAYDIERQRDSSKDHDNFKEVKNLQFSNFEAFKKIFSQEYPTLGERVSKHLLI